MGGLAGFVADVAWQGGAGGSEAEDVGFHVGLAGCCEPPARLAAPELDGSGGKDARGSGPVAADDDHGLLPCARRAQVLM